MVGHGRWASASAYVSCTQTFWSNKWITTCVPNSNRLTSTDLSLERCCIVLRWAWASSKSSACSYQINAAICTAGAAILWEWAKLHTQTMSLQWRQCMSNLAAGYSCTEISKIGPPSKMHPSPFLNKICCKGGFCLESLPTYLCCSTCGYVKQEAPMKLLCARGGTSKWRQTPFAVIV